MKFFTKRAPIPAFVVTYAGAPSSKQPILFTSQSGQVGLDTQGNPYNLDWVITSVTVSIIRDWSIARADIILTAPIYSSQCLEPSLPNLSQFRGGNNPYLTVEDEIRIYGGYINQEQSLTAELLDETPIDLCPMCLQNNEADPTPSCGPFGNYNIKQSDNKPLCPIFWGFIDTINVESSPTKGLRMVIQARDRVRVFADTNIIAIPALEGRLVDSETGGGYWQKKSKEKGLASGRREDVLMQVARAATGRIFGDLSEGDDTNKQCWRPIIGGSDEMDDNWYIPQWLKDNNTINNSTVSNSTTLELTEDEKAIVEIANRIGNRSGVDIKKEDLSNLIYTQEQSRSVENIKLLLNSIESKGYVWENKQFTNNISNTPSSESNTTPSPTPIPISSQALPPSKFGALLFTKFEYIPSSTEDFNRLIPPEDPALWMREASIKYCMPYAEPRFHIWVQRPPLTKAAGSAVFRILGKSPLEVIKFLADTEERPTDFYASHVNGDFVFGPRVLDTSGFYDPNRQYRTYYHRITPTNIEELKGVVSTASRIIEMRAYTSSLGTANRFVVMDSETDGNNGAYLDKLRATLDALPWILDGDKNSDLFKETGGRAVYPPCRNQIIYDGNLSSYGPNDFNRMGGAVIVALTQARNYAREINSINIKILGDPTFYPGEAIRIYNSILHDFGTSVNPGTKASEKILNESLLDIESLSQNDQKDRVMKIRDESEKLNSKKEIPIESSNDAVSTSFNNKAQTEEYNKLFQHQIRTSRELNKMIWPVYKVRSIKHEFRAGGANPGFITSIDAITDY